MVECLTRDRGTAGLRLTGVTALWSSSKTHLSSLVLVQPRKTCPYIAERLLMGGKESNKIAHAHLTLIQLNHWDISSLENSVDQDQLDSDEAI